MSEYITESVVCSFDGVQGQQVKHASMEITVKEEIVRCRDCRYMHTVRHLYGIDVNECWLHADSESGSLGKEWTEPGGFCAWGERRGE